MAVPKVTLVISKNDLEAHAIVKLVQKKRNVRVVDLKLGWGASTDSALMRLPVATLGEVVILVECPSPAYEQAIRASGRVLHIVDHHLRCGADGVLIDRRSTKSSLEQVAQLLGCAALDDEYDRRIAANDAGYWPGLLHEIVSCRKLSVDDFRNEALEIRKRDIGVSLAAAQGEFREATADDEARAHTALDAAQDWLKKALDKGDAAIIYPQARKGGTTDHALYLISVPETCEHRKHLSDAVYLHRLAKVEAEHEQKNLKPEHLDIDICIIGTGDDQHCARPVSMFLSGAGRLGDELEELVKLASNHPDAGGVALYAGAGSHAAFLGINGKRDIGSIVDAVLGELVQGSRTLDRYSTQFMQALRVNDSEWLCPSNVGDLKQIKPHSRTLAYFNPQIRDRLTPDVDAVASDCDFSIRTFEVPHLAGKKFEIRWGEPPKGGGESRPATHVPINRVRLHLAPERMVFVEWVIGGATAPTLGDLRQDHRAIVEGGAPDNANETPEIPFWVSLLTAHKAVRQPRIGGSDSSAITTLGDLLDVNDALRIVASAYFNPSARRTIRLVVDKGNKRELEFGASVEANLNTPAGWFSLLLDQALKPIGLSAAKVDIRFDARARTVHSAALTGPRPKTRAGVMREDTMLSRLAGVDGFEPVTYYDQAFNDAELERWRYRRFADSGTHFAASGFSFAMLGYGWFPANVITEHVWFDAKVNKPGLAPVGHVQSIYFTMFLITQMHLAVFDALAQEHGQAILQRRADVKKSDAAKKSTVAIRALRGRLTDYLASMWFDDVSPEMQGQDIYRKMLDHSGARQSFDRLRMAIADADAVEADRQEERAECLRKDAVREKENAQAQAEAQRDSLALLATFFATPLLLTSLFGPVLMQFYETRSETRLMESGSDIVLETLAGSSWFDFGGHLFTTGSVLTGAGVAVLFITLLTVGLRERLTLVRNQPTEKIGLGAVTKSIVGQIVDFLRPMRAAKRQEEISEHG